MLHDYDKIKRLQAFIEANTTDWRGIQDKGVLETDLLWEASRFWAQVIFKADPLKYECTFEDFQVFRQDYQDKNDLIIDCDKLFNTFWLRQILGFVEVSTTISSSIYHFDKLSSFKEALQFVFDFYKNLNEEKEINTEIFSANLEQWSKTSDIVIDLARAIELFGLSNKDGKIKFSDMEIYYKPYLDYWEELRFVSSFLKHYKGEQKGLFIEKNLFEKIHADFKAFFTNTPSITELKTQKVIQEAGSGYFINFWSGEVRYWSELGDKIGGYYWELLINDDSYSSDELRIRKFFIQTCYWERYGNILKVVSDHAKKRFLDAAFHLLLNEKDLEGIPDEYLKVAADVRDYGLRFLDIDDESLKEVSLNNVDLFELYESLDKWEERASTTYLHHQDSRNKISYLIKMVVRYDAEGQYEKITKLLRTGLLKPALLWMTVSYIVLYRRKIIPFLLQEIDFVPLCFKIIAQFKFPDEQKDILFQELWVKCLETALVTIRSEVINGNTAAKAIFQIYRQLNKNKYKILYNRPKKEKEIVYEYQKKNEQRILSVIEDASLYNGRVYNASPIYLMPAIFGDLIYLFKEFDVRPLYVNGTVAFPLIKWDGLIWLMKCSTYWKYKKQGTISDTQLDELNDFFLQDYLDSIEIEQVRKYNPFEKKEEIGLPLWSEKVERLRHLEWLYPFYLLHERSKLSAFLSPQFNFVRIDSVYNNKKNIFMADKLRTHIGVLLLAFTKTILPTVPYGFKKTGLEKIRPQIESQLAAYLKKYNADVPKEGRIDLLDYKMEVGFHQSEYEAILPQLSRVINWFEKKEDVLDTLTGTGDIFKTLTILEWITSEGLRKHLIEKVKQSDLQSFLEESHWFNEKQSALFKITEHKELMEKILTIIQFWDKNISKKGTNYEAALYQTKLLVAYYNKNEEELDDIREPAKKQATSNREISYSDHKAFFRALIKLHDDPEISYQIFDDLAERYVYNPVFALNRLAAKINIARKSENDDIYGDALQEWQHYESTHDIDKKELGVPFISNKLLIYLKLNEFENLNSEYEKLELTIKMAPEILEKKLESLMEQKKFGEAENLLQMAEQYHRFSGPVELELINDYKAKLSGTNDVDTLQTHYNRIYNSQPGTLIRIFPEKLNGRTELHEFIANEVALAAFKMLNKIKSIDGIEGENKYNDLIQLLLESRMSQWGWSITDQGRKGSSPGGSDLGEIDLDIQDFNHKSMATCEAFILRDATRVKTHLEKLIGDYTHNKKNLIALVYFTGKHSDFEKAWLNYSGTTVPKLTFPTSYDLVGSVEDVTKDFGCEATGIRIGKAYHGIQTIVFHIFVNIDYKAS